MDISGNQGDVIISKEPLFNPALDYLKILSDLKKKIHEALLLEKLPEAHSLLISLFYEVYPRLKQIQIDEIQIHKVKCDAMIQALDKALKTQSGKIIVKRSLQEWYLKLNLYMHKQGLGMPDKPGFENAFNI